MFGPRSSLDLQRLDRPALLFGDETSFGLAHALRFTQAGDLSQPVESLMTTEPRTLDLDQTIRDAIELMQTGRYRNVPIVDDRGRLVGVVRQVEIIKYLAESFPEELLNLPPRPHQKMRQPEGG